MDGDILFHWTWLCILTHKKNVGSSPRTTGDTIAFAFDVDVGEFYIYVNGNVLNSGNPAYTGLTNGPYYPFVTTNIGW